MFGGNKITKIIEIEGMSCGHCSKKVETALSELKEVKSVNVSLEEKKAEVILKQEVDNDVLKNIIEELGYKVVNIK